MHSKYLIGSLIALGLASSVTADVTVSYGPTQLAPGVATDITISISTDDPFGVGGVFFVFEADAGLTLSAFSWLNGLDGEEYIFTTNFPNPQTSWLNINPGGLPVGSDPVAVASVTVRAGEELAGSSATLAAFADDPFALIVADDSPGALPIAGGRSVELSVGGTSGGGDPPGSGGGEPPDPGEGEGNQGSEPEPGDPGQGGEGDPSQTGGGEGPTDPVAGEEEPASGGAEGGLEPEDDDPEAVAGGPDGGSEGTGLGGPPIAAPCGTGMIGFAFFTLTALSCIKLQRNRRRPII